MQLNSRTLTRAMAPVVSLLAVVALAAPAAAAVVGGPDISSWQHPSGHAISWTSVKASGQSFVFVKATEGPAYRNPYFAGDWSASGSAGLIHGAYHFARPSKTAGSAAAQARSFVNTAGTLHAKGSLPAVLDLEVTGGLTPTQLISWTSTWLTTAKSLTGRTPIVYSYPYFWKTSMAGTTKFRGYPLWGACYCSSPTTFYGAWTHWTFWQYSSTSTVSGISGKLDMNHFNGSLAQLSSLANGAAVSSGPSGSSGSSGSTATSVTTTTLSIAAPASVAAWDAFTVSGRLLTATGKALAGQRLVVAGRFAGESQWHDLTAVRTDSTGHYNVRLRSPHDAQVYVRFAGTSTLRKTATKGLTVTVTGGYRH